MGADPVHPIENCIADFSHFLRYSRGAFKFDRVYSDHGSFNLYFPTYVSISSIRFSQKTNSNYRILMVKCFDQKTGLFDNSIDGRGFNWTGKAFTLAMNENVRRV